MRVELQTAYILHTRAYRNTSLLLDVFTRDHGIVPMVARGVRRPRNARRVLLQPFTELHLSYSGRSELMTLTHVEPAGGAGGLSGSGLYSGFYMNELLQRLLHRHDPHPGLYRAYAGALNGLSAAPDTVERTLRRFEHRLLGELGYGLQLECEADNGRPLAAEGRYYYDIERGPVPAAAAGTGGHGPVTRGRALLALADGDFSDPESLAEIKVLMRRVLNHHLGGRPLKSRELFLKQGGAAG